MCMNVVKDEEILYVLYVTGRVATVQFLIYFNIKFSASVTTCYCRLNCISLVYFSPVRLLDFTVMLAERRRSNTRVGCIIVLW